jgi:3-phosphoshikimate 1-carboxyvinyltransferase
MKLIVKKTTQLSGEVGVPGSKSQTIRGLILGTLASGRSVLKNALESDDTKVAIEVCKGLGAKIEKNEEEVMVESQGVPLKNTAKRLNTGNSGITTRFLMPILGLRKDFEVPIILDCDEQMKARPIKPLVHPLKKMGMLIESVDNNEYCPLSVTGSLQGGKVTVDGQSSQYLSALLMSLPCAKNDSEVIVKNLHEQAYADMTLTWLDEQGIEYEHETEKEAHKYRIKGGQKYHSFEKQIPGDFSSASYLIVAGVFGNSEVRLNGLDMNDAQPDKRLIAILQDMGADIEVQESKLVIRGGKKLRGKTIDCNDIPDMVPTLAVVATQAEGETVIKNVKQARIKETDRLNSMAQGLGAMGAYLEEKEDGLVIRKSELKGAEVNGFHDHRTIMALTLAGLVAKGETVIDTAERIDKTFPNFIEVMKSLGANLTISSEA